MIPLELLPVGSSGALPSSEWHSQAWASWQAEDVSLDRGRSESRKTSELEGEFRESEAKRLPWGVGKAWGAFGPRKGTQFSHHQEPPPPHTIVCLEG